MITGCLLFLSLWMCGQGLAFIPEGALQVTVPGRDAKISYQEIDPQKVLVSVMDAEDNPVKDLMTEDFKVKKGKIDAVVRSAEVLRSRKDVGINYVLMVDNSFSMEERKAVEPLLSALDEFLNIVRPIDEVQVIVFDGKKSFAVDGHNLRLNTFKSSNVADLKSFFRKSFKEGMSSETFLYEGMLGGLHLISKLPEKSNKFLVVFSDGEDLNSNIKKEIIAPKAKAIKNLNAYCVDFMPVQKKDPFLESFAEASGGKSFKATSASSLLPIFKSISTTLLYQYVVEYDFINPPKGKLIVNPSVVNIEELTIIDSSPLLNYIFFDTGKSVLPGRYNLFKTKEEADQFDEKMLRNTITKYYQVLNIIGKRLTDHAGASIELVGCISDRGEEKNNLTLSRARAENVKSYLQYIWNIDPSRMTVTARKLPELPSTGNVEEARVENQRVEIRSSSPEILDSIKSTYTFENADASEIAVKPDIRPGYDIKDWKIEIKGDGQIIKTVGGEGNTIPFFTFSLSEYGLSKISGFENLSTGIVMTDITGRTYTPDPENTIIRYNKRVSNKAQKIEYKVMEKYALILFDYDSAAIKERNKTVIDRVVKRIKEVPGAAVTILGQTDIIGTENYNVALSQKRAKAVFEHVIGSAIESPERVSFKGNGPHDPPYDNTTPEGRSFNRTVIITLEYEQSE